MLDRPALLVGKPRLGTVFFSAREPGRPAMVFDNGEDIELTVNFDHSDPIGRRFSGRSMLYGDDPDYEIYDYSTPTQAWFQDPRGIVCLVQPEGKSHSISTLQEGRLRFAYALEVGDIGIRYDRINAMQSRIEGLEEWVPISSIFHEYAQSNDAESSSVFTVERQTPVKISSILNVQIFPTYSFLASGVPGQTTLADEMRIKTKVAKVRPWHEHLSVHRSVRDLLVVAGWRNYGTWDLRVSRHDDPQRAVAGNALGERWAEVSTHSLPKPAHNDRRNQFLFNFDDIGPRGVGRWLRLNRRHRRAIAGMIYSIGTQGISLETAISEAGAALEHLGYGIAIDQAQSPGRHLAGHLRRVAGQCQCDMGVNLETWPTRFADAYNTVKHPDRPDGWDTIDLLNILRESRLVFRSWVARHLGVSTGRLERNRGLIPMSNPYERF